MHQIYPVALLTCLLINTQVNAQVVIDNTLNPQQLVEEVLLGEGVVATNITFTGTAQQIGFFDASNGDFPLGEGVVMSSGQVGEVPGAAIDFASQGFVGNGDSDLNLVSSGLTEDAAILEFDFVPIGDSVAFNYIFASEEYPTFCCGSYNDVFAFIISGPGLNGPYSNNGQNIALLPNSNTPVSISNVNNGPENAGPCTNCTYYVNNDGGGTDGVAFNAYTVVLTALAAVECGETYHIKMAIADVADGIYDSGVFLEARSFYSTPIELTIENSLSDIFAEPTIVEDCLGAELTFTRPDTTELLEIALVFSGTAVNGVNYTGLPDTITFQPGQASVSFTLEALDDNVIQSAPLTLIITYEATTPCGVVVENEVLIEVWDRDLLEVNLELESEFVGCGGVYGYHSVTVSATGSVPPFLFDWSHGEQGSTMNFAPEVETTYTVTVTDGCNWESETATVVIPASVPAPPPSITISNDVTLLCPDETTTLTAIASNGIPPYSYSWSHGATGSSATVQPNDTTEYVVTVTDECYAGFVRDTITVNVVPYIPMTLTTADTFVTCPGNDLLLEVILENGREPVDVVWSNGLSGTSNILNPMVDEIITITATDYCGYVVSGDVNMTVAQYPPLSVTINDSLLSVLDTVAVCELWSDTLWTTASGGLLPYEYLWTGSNLFTMGLEGDSAEIRATMELPSDSMITETYSITVTDQCGVDTTVSITVNLISCDIVQPGIFSPSSDHIGFTEYCGEKPQNNVFALPCLNRYPGNRVRIFDRWGRSTYDAENYHLNPWDGDNASAGVYFYTVEVPGQEEALQGYFQLVQ